MRTRVVRGQLASGTVSKSSNNLRSSREVSLISSGLKGKQGISLNFEKVCGDQMENDVFVFVFLLAKDKTSILFARLY